MNLTSCLTDAVDLVADASVIINLNATGCGEEILRALPNRVVMAEIAANELGVDNRNGRQDGEQLAGLVESGLITLLSLDAAGEKIFGRLVAGSAMQTLDDGEAASIACAVTANARPVIDDGKAIRLCREMFPTKVPASTVDVLAHSNVERLLGRDVLADAVFNALRMARMRVLPHHSGWIVGLIGDDRALTCPSLSRVIRAK